MGTPDPRSDQDDATVAALILCARGHVGAWGPQALVCQTASLCQADYIDVLAPLPVRERSFFPSEATPNVQSGYLERAE